MHSSPIFAIRRGTIYRALSLLSLECGGRAPLSWSALNRPNLRSSSVTTPFFLLCLFLHFALCISARAIPPQQPQLNVAAAADLKFAMTELASAYEKQSGVKLNLTFGSSGNFFAQIQNGA